MSSQLGETEPNIGYAMLIMNDLGGEEVMFHWRCPVRFCWLVPVGVFFSSCSVPERMHDLTSLIAVSYARYRLLFFLAG